MAKTYADEHEEWVLEKLPFPDWLRKTSLVSVAHHLQEHVRVLVSPEGTRLDTGGINNLLAAYELIMKMETALYHQITSKLLNHYGDDEKEWWVRRVPSSIRVCCSQRRELDPTRLDAWRYLDLVDLGTIIEKNWQIFMQDFLRWTDDMDLSKKAVAKDFQRLNTLRNEVMHPLRGQVWDDDDFQFMRRFLERLSATA